MTVGDSFASHGELIRSEVAKAVASMPHSYAEPMGDQLAVILRDGTETFLPASLCLATAEAAGAAVEQALPSATAIALVEVMARGFADISSKPATGLEARWGLARSLNAGDGLFAQGQSVLLSPRDISAEQALAMTTAFDRMCSQFSKALYEGSVGGSDGPGEAALFEGGAVLGGLAAGLDAATLASLRRFAAAVTSGSALEETLTALPAQMRPRLEEAGQYIIRRRPR